MAVPMFSSVSQWLVGRGYAVALPLAFVHPWLACGIHCLVAAMWLVPDRRIETTIALKQP